MVSYGHTASNTGADADQNCVRLHAPAIPFPTYRKNFQSAFQAVQCAATLSDDETLQLIEGASDEPQDSGDSDSDEYHPSFTISTPLAPDKSPRSDLKLITPPSLGKSDSSLSKLSD